MSHNDFTVDLADLELDVESLRMLRGLDRLTRRYQENQMASLDNLTAALAKIDTDVADLAADVQAKLDDLLSQISDLTAGAITQDQIDALTASATAADEAISALDVSVTPTVDSPTPPDPA